MAPSSEDSVNSFSFKSTAEGISLFVLFWNLHFYWILYSVPKSINSKLSKYGSHHVPVLKLSSYSSSFKSSYHSLKHKKSDPFAAYWKRPKGTIIRKKYCINSLPIFYKKGWHGQNLPATFCASRRSFVIISPFYKSSYSSLLFCKALRAPTSIK